MEVNHAKQLPAVIIVMDRERARANPGKAFYLRISDDTRNVNTIDLDGESIPIGARRKALALGYDVDCWLEAETGQINRFF